MRIPMRFSARRVEVGVEMWFCLDITALALVGEVDPHHRSRLGNE